MLRRHLNNRLSWNIHLLRITCWTIGSLFTSAASTACWCLWECVLHTSGKAQNSVCVRVEDGEGGFSEASWQFCGPSLQPDGDQNLFRELRWITKPYNAPCGTSRLKKSNHLLGHTWAMFAFFLFQPVFSSATERCGGDSDILQWLRYEPLVWLMAPWSRASVMNANIWRTWWKERKVIREEITIGKTHAVYRDWRHFLPAGEPFDPVPLLNSAVANIICQIVFGRRFDYSDYNLQNMLKNLTEMAYLEGSVWALVRCKCGTAAVLHGHTQPEKRMAELTDADQKCRVVTVLLNKFLFPLPIAVWCVPSTDETPARASQSHLQQLQIFGGIDQGRDRETQDGSGLRQPTRLHWQLPHRGESMLFTFF